MEIVIYLLSQISGIVLPFGFTFGAFLLFCWSIPLLMKFFKSIF